jgi:regulation of enolase protein 1 (concanavalin A-like superfamily)
MQAAPNGDFEVEARFDGAMTAGYQIQGILVQQDGTNFLRFDIVRDPANTRFFSASFVNDAPTVRADVTIAQGAPFYLRVKRVGDQWTGSYSANGTTWTQGVTFTQALTVATVGPFAGNAGSPAPAFTGLVNHFFNTASPAVPAKVIAGGVTMAEAEETPREFSLSANYPNPFNPSTVIRYTLPHAAPVTLEVYAVTGERVRVLVRETQEAGAYSVRFDAQGLASGMYFYRIRTGDFVATKRMLLMR